MTCSDDGFVKIWDFVRGELDKKLEGHGWDVRVKERRGGFSSFWGFLISFYCTGCGLALDKSTDCVWRKGQQGEAVGSAHGQRAGDAACAQANRAGSKVSEAKDVWEVLCLNKKFCKGGI